MTISLAGHAVRPRALHLGPALPRSRTDSRLPADFAASASCVPAPDSASFDDKDGDLAVGPLLVLGVLGKGGNGPLPPQRLLFTAELAGDAVPPGGTVLDGDLLGCGANVCHPGGVRRSA